MKTQKNKKDWKEFSGKKQINRNSPDFSDREEWCLEQRKIIKERLKK